MLQIENTFFELGESCEKDCLIICDRGAMDAAACNKTIYLYFIIIIHLIKNKKKKCLMKTKSLPNSLEKNNFLKKIVKHNLNSKNPI